MHRRVIRFGARRYFLRICLAAIFSSFAAAGTFAVGDDLQFIVRGYETVTKHDISVPPTPSDSAAAPVDETIDRNAITSSAALKAALKEFYNEDPMVAHNSWGERDAIENVEQIEILEMSDTSLTLKVKYR